MSSPSPTRSSGKARMGAVYPPAPMVPHSPRLDAISIDAQAAATLGRPLGVVSPPTFAPNSRYRAAASSNPPFARRSPPVAPCSSRARRANAYWLAAAPASDERFHQAALEPDRVRDPDVWQVA